MTGDPGSSAPVRLVSLDVFRGLTMAGMVLVNNPGDWGHVYAPLLHAEWHGWTPTDLIFPFFLFIVGVSVTLSHISQGSWAPIVRRTLVLVGLGLFLNAFPSFDLATLRIPGVLQRIALCYLAAVVVYRLAAAGRTERTNAPAGTLGRVGAVAAVLLVGYWLLMTWVPPSGGRAGDLSPDGNLAAAIDRALMAGHLWKPAWDPEGLLSTLPAMATTLLGVMTGLVIRSGRGAGRIASLLAAAGLGALAAGLLWDAVFPINKNLWTSSYVLFTGGAAILALAGCYWLIERKGVRGGTAPFVILGRNAIALFVVSSIIGRLTIAIRVAGAEGQSLALKTYLYDTFYAPLGDPKNTSLLYAITHIVLLFGILTVMYRRRVFLKV